MRMSQLNQAGADLVEGCSLDDLQLSITTGMLQKKKKKPSPVSYTIP